MVYRSLDRFMDQQVVRGISRCAWHLSKLLKDPRDRLLVRQTDQPLDFLAVTKHQQSRYASDSKCRRSLRVLIHVHLYECDILGILLRQRIDRGRNRPARTALRRPKIYQHRLSRFQHRLLKRTICNFINKLAHSHTSYDFKIPAERKKLTARAALSFLGHDFKGHLLCASDYNQR